MAEFNTHEFKQAMGCFTTGIAVVSAVENNTSYGITINSFSSVSLEPPLVLFSLDKKITLHNTFTKANSFSINILADNQKHISDHFAFGDKSDWSNIPHSLSEQTHSSIIDSCLMSIECEQFASYDGGDHTIILGKVIKLGKKQNKSPLVYQGSNYYTLGSNINNSEK